MPPTIRSRAQSAVLVGERLTRRRFLRGLGAAGVAALGLAACGGAGTTPTTTGTVPSAAPSSSAAPTGGAAPAGSAAATARATGTVAAAGAAPAATASARAGAAPTRMTATTGALRLIPAAPAELGAPAVPAAAKSTVADAVPLEPAIAGYTAFGTDAAPGVFPRTIRHAAGTTEIKTKPERVLPLDSDELDSIVQLGMKPAGYLDYVAAQQPDYLAAALQGVPTVGTLAEPKLEAIAAIKPDLILTSKLRHDKITAQLKTIAPTIYGERPGLVWKQNFALHAQTLGREAEAAATVRAYEERVRKLNALLPAQRPTVSVIRVLANALRFYQRANFSGTVLTDLGFPRNTAQNVDDFALPDQGIENLGPNGDADLIVVTFNAGQESPFAKDLLASPLWQNLGAVKRGNVLFANDRVWIGGLGYRSADAIFDDLVKYFKL